MFTIFIVLEKLRTDKYNLTLRKNKIQHDFDDIASQVERVDPEFIRNLRRESSK